MSGVESGEIGVLGEFDIVTARKSVRDAAVALGFGATDVTRIVTATSELTRNIYLCAESGVVSWRPLDGSPSGIEIIFEDQGQGIADIDQAMQVGYSSGRSLGMGLPGAKRLMDEMIISSEAGVGTTIVIRKWLRRS